MDEAIRQIIEAGKEVGGATWPLLVRGELVGAWTWLIGGCTIALIFLLGGVCAGYIGAKNGDDDLMGPTLFLLGVGAALLFISLMVNIPSIVCPECVVAARLVGRAG